MYDFDGNTYNPALDRERLNKQLGRVYQIIKDGRWYTLGQIRFEALRLYRANDSEAGISARLRDLRKERFGNYLVERRRVLTGPTKGLWEYRMQRRPGSPKPVAALAP